MAHDLRSPLSSILVLAEALQQGQSGPVTDAQQRQLALIYSAALSLCTAASDTVEMVRGGTSLLHERPAPFYVSDVLHSVREIVQPMVRERPVELRFVGPALDRRIGRAGMLSRVLLNLTTNALKATDEGHVEIAVREASDNPRRVECSVEDTGRGFESEGLRASCGRRAGVRAELKAQLSSAGLGLTICRRLVAAMGSTLSVESRSGAGGTRFSFALRLPAVALGAPASLGPSRRLNTA